MKSLDPFLTPPLVAATMSKAVGIEAPKIVADFAVGDGALLVEARLRWPNAQLIGTDLDPHRRRRLTRIDESIAFGRCDFLSGISRARCRALRGLERSVDVVLLNPPFSTRGGTRWSAALEDEVVACSRGLAFVIVALNYLSERGELVSILPSSSLRSDADRPTWQRLDATRDIAVIEEFPRGTFTGCTAATSVVRLSPCAGGTNPAVETTLDGKQRRIVIATIRRGTAQLHALPPGDRYPLVHTTELQSGVADLTSRTIGAGRRTTRGPCVLLPRVGRPDMTKVAVVSSGQFVLSDCIFSLECDSVSEARTLSRRIVDDWARLESRYKASCAPYITATQLSDFLASIDVVAS